LEVSRVGLATWAIGGWMWGGTDEAESIATIRSAVDRGINLIDTAPVYGFGRSEEIVGKALAEGNLRLASSSPRKSVWNGRRRGVPMIFGWQEPGNESGGRRTRIAYPVLDRNRPCTAFSVIRKRV
jgi:hypothetical protein